MVHRRVKLAQLGTVVISLGGVAAVIWPDRADTIVKLATAVAALLGAIAGLLTVDKVVSIKTAGRLEQNQGQESPDVSSTSTVS